ncbi:MAG: hypothetical protein DRI69_11110 [Bacteroidetes bacterium]|nr:MAG: hypothetical protein DRI69_11110 [Bacteroidota bacterium]
MILMDDLANDLAELQAELADIQATEMADSDLQKCNVAISEVEVRLLELRESRRFLRAGYSEAEKDVEDRIEVTKYQILEVWDGETKTLECGDKTLKFRTSGSLIIRDYGALLTDLLQHFPPNTVTDTYLQGFNKTAVKKYMNVIPVIPDIAEILYNTSVTLEA